MTDSQGSRAFPLPGQMPRRGTRAARAADAYYWVKEDLRRWGRWADRQRAGNVGWPGRYSAYSIESRSDPDGWEFRNRGPVNGYDPAYMALLTELVGALPDDEFRLRTIALCVYRDQWSWRRTSLHVCCSDDALRHRMLRIHQFVGFGLTTGAQRGKSLQIS